MSAPVEAGAAPAPARERAPRWFLWLGVIGAIWFIWMMFESGFDLRIRSQVGELVQLAQSRPQDAARHAYAAKVAVDPNGAVRLTLKGEPELEGRLIALIPQSVDGKVIGWRCESDAPRRFLPRFCTAS
ncbi:MAG: pilin [Burkholderiales bacterium]